MSKDNGAFEGVRWLFFDVGSTLIDEERVYRHRMRDIAAASGLTAERVCEMEMAFYRQNRRGDPEVVKRLGIPKPAWYFEEEALYPDTAAALERLHSRYGIGVIANQRPGTAQRLERMGIRRHIDLVVASAEEGVAKPDRRIFELALRRAGCRPEEAAMVGDRLDNDIRPAKALGMRTVWMKQGFSALWTVTEEAETPDLQVGSIGELEKLLTNTNSLPR